MLRNLYRGLLNHELGVLGGELTRLENTLEQQAIELESYRKRFDLAQARVGMRLKRSEMNEPRDRGMVLSEEEERVLRDLRSGRHVPAFDDFAP